MKDNSERFAPLAARMRPRDINEFIGQSHLLAPDKPLYLMIKQGILHSMILWGPPGCGKTTLAKLLAQKARANIESVSAVLTGVKEIRQIATRAQKLRDTAAKSTVLFVDEVHRFNKSQQDAFLPFVEDGTLTLIGATTENPSFALNNALLSRTRVYVLKPLTQDDIINVIQQVLCDKERGLGNFMIEFPDYLQNMLAAVCDGDARQALNLMEIISDFADSDHRLTITETMLKNVLQESFRRFDKNGDMFYDHISALHKAVRGTAPDAALYWLARMLDGGCDPLYIARRVVRMASEDIGNADPRALTIALNAWDVQERLGSPEGELAIAHAIVYMAVASKSNAVYVAFNEAMKDAKNYGSLEVPLHIRNASTQLMQSLGAGKDYRYTHDEAHGYAAGENYFPDGLASRHYYRPVNRGLEKAIMERLAFFRKLDKEKI